MEADVCDEETEAYVTNLSYYHLVPFETDILEWGADARWWTHNTVAEESVEPSYATLHMAAPSKCCCCLF